MKNHSEKWKWRRKKNKKQKTKKMSEHYQTLRSPDSDIHHHYMQLVNSIMTSRKHLHQQFLQTVCRGIIGVDGVEHTNRT